jgi:hypothetical protein
MACSMCPASNWLLLILSTEGFSRSQTCLRLPNQQQLQLHMQQLTLHTSHVLCMLAGRQL